jgi:hypothetical protein
MHEKNYGVQEIKNHQGEGPFLLKMENFTGL